jgi:chemotaxis protein MotB
MWAPKKEKKAAAMNKKPRPQKKGQPDWLATYSDMITLLMCFFVLLFAMSNVDQEKFQQLADSFANRNSIFSGARGDIIGDLGAGLLPVEVVMHPEASTVDEPDAENTASGGMDAYEAAAAARALEEARQREETLGTIASSFKTYFAQNEYYDEQIAVEVNESGNYVSIIFKDGILFDSGRAELKPGAIQAIDIAADILINYANHFIRVEGHTDNVPQTRPPYPSNRHLSAARAVVVVEYLINQRGFDPQGLSAEGMGEYHPIGDNNTDSGRAENRRVEIKVYAGLRDGDAMIPVR